MTEMIRNLLHFYVVCHSLGGGKQVARQFLPPRTLVGPGLPKSAEVNKNLPLCALSFPFITQKCDRHKQKEIRNRQNGKYDLSVHEVTFLI